MYVEPGSGCLVFKPGGGCARPFCIDESASGAGLDSSLGAAGPILETVVDGEQEQDAARGSGPGCLYGSYKITLTNADVTAASVTSPPADVRTAARSSSRDRLSSPPPLPSTGPGATLNPTLAVAPDASHLLAALHAAQGGPDGATRQRWTVGVSALGSRRWSVGSETRTALGWAGVWRDACDETVSMNRHWYEGGGYNYMWG